MKKNELLARFNLLKNKLGIPIKLDELGYLDSIDLEEKLIEKYGEWDSDVSLEQFILNEFGLEVYNEVRYFAFNSIFKV